MKKMKIKFLKDYRYPGGGYSNRGDVQTFEDAEFAKWAIDNGFAEEVKESGWWKPKYGEKYFSIGHDCCVYSCTWENDKLDNGRLELGLVFKTKEAGIRCCDYLKAISTVRQDEGVLTPEEITHAANTGTMIGRIIVDDMTGDLIASFYNLYTAYPSVGAIYFDTRDHAKASLDKHPGEWKTITSYDWSRE